MKTDDLISLLATDTAPVRTRAASRQLAVAMSLGISLSIATMLLTIGARPDVSQAVLSPMFWVKVLFPFVLACASFATLARLARPGVSARAGEVANVLPVLLLWLVAIAVYANAPEAERASMVWGESWRSCILSVLVMSGPIFVAAFLALRQLAPTRLSQAGAYAGALSGEAAAAIYAFHCPETALPFMAIWYIAAIAIAAGIGAALGPRLLKW
ncbi:DUF1109 domain-containing protein [Ramlibacter sp.]|uniref:DUF1109 domain-containing protein n=1 Tax=Ramlibacter sp. TaxID=1917967 RepID=UPI0017CB7883|nr:DUF1109 domain-containing protein [Ramlibacter sp.]MBA2675941.1 DUF1109 domain-containing protein [Ramlibacter sp.]